MAVKIKKEGTIHKTVTGYDFTKDDPLIKLKAIRLKCLDCMGGQEGEIRRCATLDCGLWPWRCGNLKRTKRWSNEVIAEIESGVINPYVTG